MREKMDVGGRRGIRDYMPEQHREFFAQQPFLIVGSMDAQGQPWASMLTGAPGFVSSPDERTLRIRARPPAGDPLRGTLAEGARIGLLGIEFATRRRNRMNGIVSEAGEEGFAVRTLLSFGNCPKYIQRRDWRTAGALASPAVERRLHLSDDDRALIRNADTFFIASANPVESDGPRAGADVSHRGGRPGFVRIDGDTLTVPDFIGNFFFNTLGNLSIHPAAGLLFIDFAEGDLLYIACAASIVWEGEEVAAFPGAQRLTRFAVKQAIRTRGSHPLRWSTPEYSPALEKTGNWPAGGYQEPDTGKPAAQ